MQFFDNKEQLREEMLTDVIKVIQILQKQYQDHEIYAFVIYASSCFDDIGIVYSTRSSLKKIVEQGIASRISLLERINNQPNVIDSLKEYTVSEFYYEVTSCEWEYINPFCEMFSRINNAIEEGYNDLYDEGIEVSTFHNFIEMLLTEAIIQLIDEKAFSIAAFEDDILLGIQFSDPDPEEVEMVKRVSQKVNSPYWHERVCDGYMNNAYE